MTKDTTDGLSPINGNEETTDDRVVMDVPEAGALLGLSRNGSYEAAKRGDIPTIKIGKLFKVPKVAFARMLEKLTKEAS